MIKARCENADKGCTEVVSYSDLERHQGECGYAIIKCTNYQCDAPEMFQKDFKAHEDSCEYRENRCESCDVIKLPGKEHDCVVAMAAKYEHMEGKLIKVS